MPIKKSIIVVKEIKPENPKRGIFIARKVKESSDTLNLEPSYMGNTSPQRPMRNKDGKIISRSILGEPEAFEQAERMKNWENVGDNNDAINLETGMSLPASNTSSSRVLSVTSKRTMTASQSQALLNPTSNKDMYLETLKSVKEQANKVREMERTKEQTLMEYLPVNEKFNLNKEGKVLTRWQERQRNWKRIQASLSNRLRSSPSTLLMATTDEFRAKAEEYDILQAAIPPHEKYGIHNWEMQLRGGGSRAAPVGHIFSGLSCPIKDTVAPPVMVRAAKSAAMTRRKGVSYLDETPALKAMRKRLKKNIETIRPYNMNMSDAEALCIKSTDLFEWAYNSSKAYFDQLKAAEEAAALAAYQNENDTKSETEVDAGIPGGPVMELLTPKEIVFNSRAGEVVYRTISFKNIGSTVLSYDFKFLPERAQGVVISEVSYLLSDREQKPREYTISKERSSFFCVKDKGQALPGEIINTVFTFCSRSGGGTHTQTIVLETTPRCTVINTAPVRFHHVPASISSINGVAGEVSLSSITNFLSPFNIKLRAHTESIDTHQHRRLSATAQLDKMRIRTFCREILEQCILRVRTPVRMQNIVDRQINTFNNINKELLTSLSEVFADYMPLFITTRRLEQFEALYERIKKIVKIVRNQLTSTMHHAASYGYDYSDDIHSLSIEQDWENDFQTVKNSIFPEKDLEVFDEISEEKISVAWDMNITSLTNVLERSLARAIKTAELEQIISVAQAKLEKERIRAAKKAAAKDSDDSDDDEEDEEEEEEEEEDALKNANKSNPNEHKLYCETQELLSDCQGKLCSLALRPLPDIYGAAKKTVESIIDSLVDLAVSSLAEAQIPSDAILPRLPRPYDSPEEEAAWNKMITGIDPDESNIDSKSNKKAAVKKEVPMKGKKNVPVVNTGPTDDQVSNYRKSLFNGTRESIYRLCVDGMFSDLDCCMEDNAINEIKKPYSALETVAAVRKTDIFDEKTSRGAVVFIHFDGDAFVEGGIATSAFNEIQLRRSCAVQPICNVARLGAAAVVLLFEKYMSSATSLMSEEWSLLSAVDSVKTELDDVAVTDAAAYQRRVRKRRRGEILPPPPPQYSVIPCSTIANLQNHLADVSLTALSSSSTVPAIIPVFVLETICKASQLVPDEPDQPDEVSEDDEAPIPLGRQEAAIDRAMKWKAQAPRRITMKADDGANAAGSSGEQNDKLSCLTDITAALTEIISNCSRSSRYSDLDPLHSVWIEDCPTALFSHQSSSVLRTVKLSDNNSKLLSRRLRETMLWVSTLRWFQASHWERLRSQFLAQRDINELEEGQMTVTTSAATTPASYFFSLFPISAPETASRPRLLAVVGGQLRADKFRILDQLIDMAEAIYLVGEMCYPFLALTGKVTLKKYSALCGDYLEPSLLIVNKAKLRGIRLLLPEDVVTGDEAPKEGDRRKCFLNVDVDSRDEGGDYEGESHVSLLCSPPPEPVAEVTAPTAMKEKGAKKSTKSKEKEPTPVATSSPPSSTTATTAAVVSPVAVPIENEKFIVSDYIFDVGPRSCKSLKEEISLCDALITWGVPGFCELSAFQTSQRAIVAAAARQYNIDGTEKVSEARKPLHTIVIGETAVEWWARICDPEGESNGDLIRSKAVSFASRDSALLAGVLGNCVSLILNQVQCREPVDDEWIFERPRLVKPGEEEEDDDDEEEEEDEEDDD